MSTVLVAASAASLPTNAVTTKKIAKYYADKGIVVYRVVDSKYAYLESSTIQSGTFVIPSAVEGYEILGLDADAFSKATSKLTLKIACRRIFSYKKNSFGNATTCFLKKGDLNHDEIYTSADTAILHKMIANSATYSSIYKDEADINGDGKLTITDLTLFKSCYEGTAARPYYFKPLQ